MNTAFENIKSRILEARRCGTTTVAVQPRSRSSDTTTTREHVDVFASSLGFTPLGDEWMSISADDAVKVLTHVLSRDLAYGVSFLASEDAESLAHQFKQFFSDDCAFYTNGGLAIHGKTKAWSPLTTATFDTGVVFIDDTHTGIVWVEDED